MDVFSRENRKIWIILYSSKRSRDRTWVNGDARESVCVHADVAGEEEIQVHNISGLEAVSQE